MRFLRSCVASVLFAAVAAPALAQSVKVGWVNTVVVLREFPMAQEAQKMLDATLQGYQAEMQQLNEDMQAALQEYQQQQLTMTPENRRAKEEELMRDQTAIQQRGQELEGQAQQRRNEVFEPVMAAISSVIEEIRVEGSYSMILDAASQAILAADPALELTQLVLDRLQAASGSGASPGTGGAAGADAGSREGGAGIGLGGAFG